MARYKPKKTDIRDVVQVARLYNAAWREFVRFPTTDSPWENEPRYSDYDLWNKGLPAVTHRATLGDGFAELAFTFQNTPKDRAEEWVKDFMGSQKLPYTYFRVMDPASINHLLPSNNEKYTRVIVRFEEDDDINRRTRQLRP